MTKPASRAVDLERENAELRRQLAESLAQQTATAEVLAIINASSGDLQPVFEAIVEKAMRLCGAAFGGLHTYDGERFTIVVSRGDPRYSELVRGLGPVRPDPNRGTTIDRIAAGERIVQIADIAEDLGPQAEFSVRRATVEIGGFHTLLSIALRQDEKLFGALHVYRREVRPFTDKQIALLQNFAAQAVIAIENARLITETREALDQQTATAEVLGIINSSPGDLTPVFGAILEKAMRLCSAAFGVMVVADGNQTRTVATRGLPAALAEFRRRDPVIAARGTLFNRVLAGESFVHTLDLKDDDLYRNGEPLRRANVDLGGARTSLYVALKRERQVLGAIHIYRQEVRPFSDKEIALLQNFAAQAVIAMENARLLTETREALDRQTATAEVLGVINSSPGDLAPVFDAILEKAHALCDAPCGSLQIFDGELFRAVATRGLPEAYATILYQGVRSAVVDPGAIVQFDFAERAARSPDNQNARIAVEVAKLRTVLFVPLRKDDVLVGRIAAGRQEARPFTDKQIALLQNFAAQAVIAMENARLITETREALEQQTATAEVLQAINASPGDLTPVFDAMLEKAMRLCEAAFGSLLTYDGERLRAAALRAVPAPFADYLGESLHPEPESALGRVISERSLVHILDCAAGEAYRNRSPLGVAGVELGGVRTLVAVPLVKDAALLGVFHLYRQEVRPFSDKQIALLQNFAAQAVIAMENARLITETREALEQQTATAEVLGVINSSPGNLAPVFDAMLEKAMRLCEASFGTLSRIDGENFYAIATHGAPAAFAEAMRQPHRITPGNAHHRLVLGEDVVQIEDVTADDAYRSGNPARRLLADIAGARTALWVALRREGEAVGAFVVYRREVRLFTEKQIALLQNFAAQAVIAMENARLITETREALEQQTATAEVLGVINSSPGDLEPVFEAMLEKAMRLCEAPFGVMLRFQDARFTVAASRDVPAPFHDYLRSVDYQPQGGIMLARLQSGAPYVHTINMKDDDAYRSGAPLRRAAVDLAGARHGLFVSLRKDRELLGTFNLWRTEVRPFSDKQIALLQNFAAQAVIAMENARLITETREALEQQTATAEVLQVINSSPGDLAPVFNTMLERAMRLCEGAFGYLMTHDGERFQPVAHQGLPPRFAEYLPRMDQPGPGGAYAKILGGAPFVHVADLMDGGVYQTSPLRQALVDLGGARTGMIVALRKDERLLGVLTIYRQEVRPFTDQQVALLENFAAQAVIAMENARLLGELRQRTEEVAGLNRDLEARVTTQLAELERTGKLRRFLAPQLADLIVAQGDESILESHRREIVVVFCDLRGFTSFAERAEPEEVMALLKDYHGALGPIVARFEGTLDHYAGDGIMVFFNDPVPTPEPARRAIEMAVAMREAAQGLLQTWRRHGHDIGFGVGISQGYATLGQIGFAERMDYTAIGTVTNLAARLCGEAKDGQILVSRRVATAVEDSAALEEIGDVALKGLSQAVAVYNVAR